MAAKTSKTIAVGDVHGEPTALQEILRHAQVIDGSNHWASGGDTLVQMGNVIDRGPMSKQAHDFLNHLQRLSHGKDKRSLLRVIDRSRSALPLRPVLRIIRLSPSRYHQETVRQFVAAERFGGRHGLVLVVEVALQDRRILHVQIDLLEAARTGKEEHLRVQGRQLGVPRPRACRSRTRSFRPHTARYSLSSRGCSPRCCSSG